MKIAFVYEYGTESWSSPSSLMGEFKLRGWDVSRYHLTNGDTDQLTLRHYDIILTMDWKGIDIPTSVFSNLVGDTFLIRENADTPQNFHKHIQHSSKYNLILTPDYYSSENYNELGFNSVWFNHFADTNIHNNYSGFDYYPPVRSTRGPGGSQFMDQLQGIMPEKFVNKNGMIGIEYGMFLNNGKIVLQNSRWQEITRRIFEGMACGRLVITDRLPEHTHINDLFIENEDIIYYDNYSDCISKINYYLCEEGEAERNRIQKNGYDKVKANHTQVQRTDLIISKFNEWKKLSR